MLVLMGLKSGQVRNWRRDQCLHPTKIKKVIEAEPLCIPSHFSIYYLKPMMRSLLVAVLLMTFVTRGSAQSSGFGKPLLWYSVYNPWSMFMGADGPIFAVYETGQVIYWRNGKYHLIALSAADVQDFLAKFHLSDTVFSRSKWYHSTDYTDQPTYTLVINLDTLKRFSIYGDMQDRNSRAKMPEELVAAYNLVTTYSDDQAVDWLPDKIEILLSDYDNSPEQPIPWPLGWPDLSNPDSRRWENGGGSLFLNERYFTKLRQLLASRKEKQAFLINGNKFYVGYRLPLPGVDSAMAVGNLR